MSLRRILPVALVVLAACPSVERVESPEKLAFATFDAATSTIPLPNDLALQRAPALPAGVQRELLGSFVAAGGFPADQEVAVTIPITIRTKQADGSYAAPAAPAGLDLTTVDDARVALFRVDVSPAQRLSRCATPVTATCWEPSYAAPAGATSGQLTLRRNDPSGSRRWDAGGRYVVGLRTGVVTSEGLTVNADGPVALIAQNKVLTSVENQPPGLPPATAATAEQLRGVYATGRTWSPVPTLAVCAAGGVPVAPCWLPLPSATAPASFDVVKGVFPLAELAAIQTFTVQPAGAVRPLTDTGSGQLPLPSDFLLDPATGKVRNVPAFGPAAAGLATLDGFSTTAPLLIPLSGAVDATTILPSSARVFEVTAGGPVPVVGMSVFPTAPPPAGAPQLLVQPPTAVSNGASTSIVLAPAVPIEAGTTNVYLPPLKEKTQYLVLVTNGVKDAAGQPLKRSTLMDLVFTFSGDLCVPKDQPATCVSQIPGVANADAAGLQALRTKVKPLLQALSLDSCANNATCAVLAYTVKTQSVKDVSILLSAAPYGIEATAGAAIFSPSGTAEFQVPAGLGIPPTFTSPSVAKVFRTTFPTLYAIQGSTGAFDPAFATWTPAQVQQHLQPIPALVAVPTLAAAASQPACPGAASALKCAPLVVYQHGLGGSTWQMLAVADALAAKGFVVAAIDMPYHGERSYCKSNAECVQANGSAGVCTPNPALATPVDAVAPGSCTTGTFAVNPSLYAQAASGNYFVSSNFFRTRDALRQLLLDQSALTLALARPPVPPQPPANDLAAALAGLGVAIDPTRVFFSGFSTGGMAGVSVVATNPRFKVATFTEAGGTLVDVFTQGVANQASLPAIFSPLGIDLACVSAGTGCDPATRAAQSAKYAQALALAKWILDPADPVNYAANVPTKAFHPNLAPLVAGGVLGSASTATYGQLVTGGQTVPNQNTRELFSLAGVANFATYTSAGAVEAKDRHNLFIRNFLAPTSPLQQGGDAMRADLASFLATGTAPTPSAIP